MRTLSVICLTLFSIVCSAQLKVNSNGNTQLGSNTSVPQSLLSVNSAGRSGCQIMVESTNVGIHSRREGNAQWGNAVEARSVLPNTNFSVAVRADADSSTPLSSGRAFGIYGVAGNATTGWNYGVFGRLGGTNNGAGVYGTSNANENGTNTGGRYAGYFNGATKVVGDLTVTGAVQGMVLGKAVSSETSVQTRTMAFSSEESSVTLLDKLNGLSLMSYYISQPKMASMDTMSAMGDTIVPVQELTNMEAQCLEKMHYALSADQMQEDFPDLVYEKEDGTKAINYIELVPVLVQTINELNNRLVQLEKNSSLTEVRTTANVGFINDMETCGMEQNTPNPFEVETIIPLNVPTSAKSAKLCVYDLNGTEKKTVQLSDRGSFSYNLSASDLNVGMYLYTLIVDGKVVSTKRMIVSK